MTTEAQDRLDDAFVERLVIGTEAFIASIRERMKGSPPPAAVRRTDRAQVRPPLADHSRRYTLAEEGDLLVLTPLPAPKGR